MAVAWREYSPAVDSAHAFMEMAAQARRCIRWQTEEDAGPCRRRSGEVSYPVNTSRNGETIA